MTRRTTVGLLLGGAIALAGVASPPATHAADRVGQIPLPSKVQVSWELDFVHETPRRMVIETGDGKLPQAYWVMPYAVTNNDPGGERRLFMPRFEMLLEDGRVLLADRGIPRSVFEQVKVRDGNPLLLPASQIIGELPAGPDQVRFGVAIWEEPQTIAVPRFRDDNPPDGDAMPDSINELVIEQRPFRMGRFTIFVSGLSGEAVELVDVNGQPVMTTVLNIDNEPVPAPLMLRKTLQLDFTARGDEAFRQRHRVEQLGRTWVMR